MFKCLLIIEIKTFLVTIKLGIDLFIINVLGFCTGNGLLQL